MAWRPVRELYGAASEIPAPAVIFSFLVCNEYWYDRLGLIVTPSCVLFVKERPPLRLPKDFAPELKEAFRERSNPQPLYVL
jgi:hypothetical protein